MSHGEELERILGEIRALCRRRFSWFMDSGIRCGKPGRPYAWWYGGYAGKMDVEICAYSRTWVRVSKMAGTWSNAQVFKGKDAIQQALEWAVIY